MLAGLEAATDEHLRVIRVAALRACSCDRCGRPRETRTDDDDAGRDPACLAMMPRVSLGTLPTPLVEAPRLARELASAACSSNGTISPGSRSAATRSARWSSSWATPGRLGRTCSSPAVRSTSRTTLESLLRLCPSRRNPSADRRASGWHPSGPAGQRPADAYPRGRIRPSRRAGRRTGGSARRGAFRADVFERLVAERRLAAIDPTSSLGRRSPSVRWATWPGRWNS